MLKLSSNITIEGQKETYVFDFVCDVEIESSWVNLTDTCSITLPKKAKWLNKDLISSTDPLIKRGDYVTVKLGYDGVLNTYFEGYISKVHTDTPLRIECEDAMWKLKQLRVAKFSSKSVTLKELLTGIGVDSVVFFVSADIKIGQFKCSNISVAGVLEFLRKEYGIVSFIRDGFLYSGLAYWFDSDDIIPGSSDQVSFTQETIRRVFQDSIIGDNLEYMRIDDKKIKVVAKSLQTNNEVITVEVGDVDGDTYTYNDYSINEAELRKRALLFANRLRYEGFKGSFTTFGDQKIKHGDIVKLENELLKDQNGNYLVKSVRTSFGTDGFRQEVELDNKVNA